MIKKIVPRNFSKYIVLSLLSGLVFLMSCSKDDSVLDEDPFYANRQTAVVAADLAGRWALHKVTYAGVTIDVPEPSSECGRDFVEFISDGTYVEYLLDDTSQCTYFPLNFTWELEDGVVIIRDAQGESQEMVIEYLDQQEWRFRVKMDIDEDGKDDIVVITAYRYVPKDADLYSYSFHRNLENEHMDKFRFEWNAYNGLNEFDRYEVYRSQTGSKQDAQLLAVITEKEVNYYVDDDPPVSDRLYYYFKVFTNEGPVAESILYDIETEYLYHPPVTILQPVVAENEILISWEEYTGYYFSHYEITLRNFDSGSGSNYQEYTIATLDDKAITQYSHQQLPLFMNPVYGVYAVDIFGNKNSQHLVGQNSLEVAFKPKQLVGYSTVEKIAVSQTTPHIYMYGKTLDESSYKLCAYNYETGAEDLCADAMPSAYNDTAMKLINTEYGEELVFAQGTEFLVYDAASFVLKYKLSASPFIHADDFAVLDNGVWVLTDHDEVYTLTRNHDALTLVDRKPHFEAHQGSYNYEILKLGSGNFLVGHRNEASSMQFRVADGNLLEVINGSVAVSMKSLYFSGQKNLVVNAHNKTLLRATDLQVTDTYTYPAFAYGLSRDGNRILGSVNDPSGSGFALYPHERNAYVHDISAAAHQVITTQGYPHFVFETLDGKIATVSSGLLRDNLNRASKRPDILVEILN